MIPELSKFSKKKLILVIIIGLLYSISLYSILYIFREALRLLSKTDNYDLWILTDKEVDFYNLIFAFLSTVIAHSVVITFLFDRPKKFLSKSKYRITSIINDQRNLNWYFLNWFSKLAFLFGLFFGMIFYGGHYTFSLYPNYNYIFILIIITLFFQSWTTIILTFKRKAYKWILYSIIGIIITSFSLSYVNLIDYNAINKSILDKNIYKNYKLELPETEYYTTTYSFFKIFIVQEKMTNKTICLYENKEISLNKIKDIIPKFYRRNSRSLLQLYIHKSIKMSYIKRLISELSDNEISKIGFSVTPNERVYNKQYYQDYVYTKILPNKLYLDLIQMPHIIQKKEILNSIRVIARNNEYIVNGIVLKRDEVKETIKQLIIKNPAHQIEYTIDINTDFENYLYILTSTRKTIEELRNVYSKYNYNKPFEDLYGNERQKVIKHFPFKIIENIN